MADPEPKSAYECEMETIINVLDGIYNNYATYTENADGERVVSFDMPPVPGNELRAETREIEAETNLEVCDSSIQEICELIEQERQLTANWHKVTDKLPREEKKLQDREFSKTRDDLNVALTMRRSKNLQRQMVNRRANLLKAVRYAQREIADNQPAAPPQAPVYAQSALAMPRIDIPFFEGDIIKFPVFWQMFTSQIDSRTMHDTLKFSYLLSRLKGEAYQLISNMSPTEANYQIAKTTLEEMYGKPEVITRIIRNKILTQECGHNRKDVRNFVFNVESLLKQIE